MDASLMPIYQIQGSGFNSLYKDATVLTHGVVSADFDDDTAKGFSYKMMTATAIPPLPTGFLLI